MAYLFACNVGTLVSVPFDTHGTRVSRVRPVAESLCACVPAARLCIYASGTKPLSRGDPGQRPRL